MRRVRDFADVKTKGIINVEIAKEALEALKVDEAGLEQLDRDYLSLIIQKFSAGPVGLDTLATASRGRKNHFRRYDRAISSSARFYYEDAKRRIATDLAFSHLGEVDRQRTKIYLVNESSIDSEFITRILMLVVLFFMPTILNL